MTQEQDRFYSKRLRELADECQYHSHPSAAIWFGQIAAALRQAASDAEARESPPSAPTDPRVFVVFKDGTWQQAAPVYAAELANNDDWLVSIYDVTPAPSRAFERGEQEGSPATCKTRSPPSPPSAMGEAELRRDATPAAHSETSADK